MMMRPGPLILTLALCAPSCVTPVDRAQREPREEPFRVLLLGDSISVGYTPFVQLALADRAHVVRPMHAGTPARTENCAGTNNGVQHIDRWLAIDGGQWDVIHFNFGLHDLKRVQPDSGQNSDDPDDPHQADPERYGTQLRAIVERLQASGARLIFATTTPIPEGEMRPFRAPADVLEYNRIALGVMYDAHVPLNDLYRFVLDHGSTLQLTADVHFTKEGSRALGDRVVEAILREYRTRMTRLSQ